MDAISTFRKQNRETKGPEVAAPAARNFLQKLAVSGGDGIGKVFDSLEAAAKEVPGRVAPSLLTAALGVGLACVLIHSKGDLSGISFDTLRGNAETVQIALTPLKVLKDLAVGLASHDSSLYKPALESSGLLFLGAKLGEALGSMAAPHLPRFKAKKEAGPEMA